MTRLTRLRLSGVALVAAVAALVAGAVWERAGIFAIFVVAGAAVSIWLLWRNSAQRVDIIHGAVDALGDGFILYDRDDRVVLTNRRYREFHTMNPLASKIGARFEDLFRQAVVTGETPLVGPDLETMVRKRLESHRNPGGPIERFSGGRWLRISEHRTLDGGIVGIHADITELKATQDAAEAAEQLLHDAVDSISEGFVIFDAEDRLVLCNQRYKDLYAGITDAIVPGVHFEDLVRVNLAAGKITDAIGREEEWLAERMHQHRQGETTLEERRQDGRWVLVTERRTHEGGVAGMRIDITALKNAQADARAAQARMADFAEAAIDWFWEAGLDGNLIYLSDPFEAATGITVASRIGAMRLDINRKLDPDNPNWEEHLRDVAAQKPFRDFVMTVPTPKGTKHLSVSGKPIIRAGGEFCGYRGTTVDVTLVTEAQRTLARQAEELTATTRKLLAANAAKSLFLANMSHELRTPLNAVLGFAEIIRDALTGPLGAKYREYAGDIHNAAGHLLQIINDVLETTKMEAGQIDLREEWVELAGIVTECRTLVSDKVREGKLVFEIDAPDRWPIVYADRLRLKQALLNILSNAVKFTPAGGTITVAAVRPADGGFTVAVADSGIGMKLADVALALEPFRQLDTSFARRYQGTGLGLPLAKTFVELHQGTLDIESEPDKGTTVRLWLPPQRLAAQQEQKQQSG